MIDIAPIMTILHDSAVCQGLLMIMLVGRDRQREGGRGKL